MATKILLYSDGGARGNPGPAASAFIALTPEGAILKADAKYVGNRTNNQAEYEALLLGLRYASEQHADEVVCYLDSELVGKQLLGKYQVKNAELQQLYVQAKALLAGFKKVTVLNVPRENTQIGRADALVNRTLDEATKHPSAAPKALAKKAVDGVFMHASIRVSNLQRSIDFYNRYLGLEVTAKMEHKEADSDLVFMRDPKSEGGLIELTRRRTQKEFVQPPMEKRLFDHLGFKVSDIFDAVGEMMRGGVKIVSVPKKFNAETLIAFVEDPDGTLIELIQHI